MLEQLAHIMQRRRRRAGNGGGVGDDNDNDGEIEIEDEAGVRVVLDDRCSVSTKFNRSLFNANVSILRSCEVDLCIRVWLIFAYNLSKFNKHHEERARI